MGKRSNFLSEWVHTRKIRSTKERDWVFKKLLIANRGEIAVRIIRSAKELGITTVAVYSELDRNSLHVRYADEAYALEGKTAQESYLNTQKLLHILSESGADALHPGYGFFSENADFARAVTVAGITFIGPPPQAIEIMGDKISSRLAAASAGVKGVPGTNSPLKDATEIIEFAETNGWPVAIKAAYGGGGRGMRVVASQEGAEEALASARREAEGAFGRSECYLERYLSWPRHIEMQVFADSHGNTVWLGERDCSSQRRHQKLIEESPAANFPESIRSAMGEAAVAVAKACGYQNAGTVEFLFQDGEFFFLEMNTRLQVEHPVTEAITGLDLVEMQIRVAAGEPLGVAQDEIRRRGAAIECRINAENPSGGKFLPSPGKITRFRRADGFGIRTDSGYDEGDSVSQFYDNLIAKVISWGETREIAIARMIRALGETEVSGVHTTIPAHLRILNHPDFREARHSTKWVEQAAGLDTILLPEQLQIEGGESHEQDPVELEAEVNGKKVSVKLFLPPSLTPSSTGSTNPSTPTSSMSAPRRKGSSIHPKPAGSGESDVKVPMQGTVVKVMVEVGQIITPGQTVIVLEAMKMENSILAEKAGTVREVRVVAGDTVGTGDVVAVID